MQKDFSGNVFGAAFGEGLSSYDPIPFSSSSSFHSDTIVKRDEVRARTKLSIIEGAYKTISLLSSQGLPGEDDAKRQAFFGTAQTTEDSLEHDSTKDLDQFYSFHASFSSIVFSLVDSSPTEIATVSFKNVTALAKWNALRTNAASGLVSIGWLQVDK